MVKAGAGKTVNLSLRTVAGAAPVDKGDSKADGEGEAMDIEKPGESAADKAAAPAPSAANKAAAPRRGKQIQIKLSKTFDKEFG
mmetsp:Transcript_15430/g.46544  ORF Transcript_15430/g.46544 Transcript_15430/m.46544 type:complete len:84 (+) Transcript_15430:621-872(+)